MNDLLTIIKRNFISLNVLTIYALSFILLILGEVRDALFLSGVITVNTIFAVIQELRARNELKKLELLTAPTARLINKNGVCESVTFEKLKIGDEIELKVGDEVPADGSIFLSVNLEVDEGILTGESASIEKHDGENIKAGSIVVAGSACVKIKAIGPDSMTGKMLSTLKKYKPILTPTQRSILTVINWLAYIALVLSTLIYIVYSLYGYDKIITFKTITVSAVAIVPEGLLLASTVLLAFGSVKLAKAKVLPQKISAIEAMALLNILCVDKTGTLTSDEISFEKVESFVDDFKNLTDLIGVVAKETSNGSATGEAVVSGLNISSKYKVIETLEFSSARKMSGVRFIMKKESYSLIMGAPEYVAQVAPLSDNQQKIITELSQNGKRVLLVASIQNKNNSLKKLDKAKAIPLGLVVLENRIRKGVKKTIKYLQDSGVNIKVISGDNPNTVKYIAEKVGIYNSQNILTGSDLKKLNDDEWDEAILQNTIFARVLPQQKDRIVLTYKKYKNFTGMVGDGVNDALAIKTSDLGIAMYDGAIATRRVADIILMDNSFNSLPLGMRLGNRIIQAIELIATLFFHKNIQWVIILIMTLIVGQVYPFLPRHLTFMNTFLVTMPTIIWTIFMPRPKSRLSIKYFWRDTLLAIFPIAVLSGLVLSFVYIYLHMLYPGQQSSISTTMVIIATIIGAYMVFLTPKMFNIKHTKKTIIGYVIYTAVCLLETVVVFGIGFMRDFFDFSTPIFSNILPLITVIIGIAILQWKVAIDIGQRIANRNPNKIN